MAIFRRARGECPTCHREISKDTDSAKKQTLETTCCEKSIKLAVSPWWWCSYKGRDGRQHRKNLKVTDYKIAEARYHALINELHNPNHKPVCTTTLAVLADKYFATLKGLRKPENIVKARSAYMCVAEYLGTLTLIDDIRPVQLEDFVTDGLAGRMKWRTKKHPLKSYAAATLKGSLNRLIVAIRWAKKHSLCTTIPDMPDNLPESNKRTRFITMAEVEQLADEMGEWCEVARDGVLALGLTGCRWAEIFRMEWTWVDFNLDRISLPGSGRKNAHPLVIPMGDALRAVMERRRERADGPYPFHRNGQPMIYSTWRLRFIKACKKLGIADFTTHDTRHSTAATIIFDLDGTQRDVQGVLGHKSASSTERYLPLIQEAERRRMLNKLRLGLGPEPPPAGTVDLDAARKARQVESNTENVTGETGSGKVK